MQHNAVAESFFATLRTELIDREYYAARHEVELPIGYYIDNFYKVERRHFTLITPTSWNSNCGSRINHRVA